MLKALIRNCCLCQYLSFRAVQKYDKCPVRDVSRRKEPQLLHRIFTTCICMLRTCFSVPPAKAGGNSCGNSWRQFMVNGAVKKVPGLLPFRP